MTALLNPKLWIALALAAVLAFTHTFVYRSGRAAVRTAWDAQKLVDAESARKAEEERQERFAERQKSTDEEARHAQEQITSLQTDLSASRDAGERLRRAIRAATDAARAHPSTASTGAGQPDIDPVGMFAQLLERADARDEVLSGYADRLRIAGQTCEQYADRLQPAPR